MSPDVEATCWTVLGAVGVATVVCVFYVLRSEWRRHRETPPTWVSRGRRR